MLDTVLKKNEQNYYYSHFNYNKDNLKICWTLIKQVMNRKSVVFKLVNSDYRWQDHVLFRSDGGRVQ